MTASLEHHYRTLGVGPAASDEEVRRAYRRLVQLHHPDHNGGSPEAARRFEQIHTAYEAILRARTAAALERAASVCASERASAIEARVVELERALAAARRARERRERRAARLRRLAQRRPPVASDPALAELNGLIQGLERLASSLDHAIEQDRRAR